MSFRTYLERSFTKIYEKYNFFCAFCLRMFHNMFVMRNKPKTTSVGLLVTLAHKARCTVLYTMTTTYCDQIAGSLTHLQID